MLVLTRKVNEVIMIGDDVRVVVVSVDGDRVRIAVEAPPDVKIHRGEVYARLREASGTRDNPPAS